MRTKKLTRKATLHNIDAMVEGRMVYAGKWGNISCIYSPRKHGDSKGTRKFKVLASEHFSPYKTYTMKQIRQTINEN